MDAEAVRRDATRWDELLSRTEHCLVDLSKVRFIDSSGVGLLIKIRKRAGRDNRHVILVSPSQAVKRVLTSMRLWPFFLTAPDALTARAMLDEFSATAPAALKPSGPGMAQILAWNGEITAGNADAVWKMTETYIHSCCAEQLNPAIDLSRVEFIDSTGLGLMVRSKKQAMSRGVRLRFVGVQGNVRNVVRISKLEAYILESSDA
jgi:anti-anti-sigma factor